MIDGEEIGTRAESTYAWIVGVGGSSSGEGHELAGYPNPASSDYFLSLRGSMAPGDVEVSVFDALGRKRRRYSFPDPRRIRLDVSDLAAGIYFARVEADGINVSKRFVIVR